MQLNITSPLLLDEVVFEETVIRFELLETVIQDALVETVYDFPVVLVTDTAKVYELLVIDFDVGDTLNVPVTGVSQKLATWSCSLLTIFCIAELTLKTW